MTASSPLPAPNLMPLMRYRDLAEAMSWLERAFGFEKQIAVTDSDGAVIYGQMIYRGSLIMMGAVRDTDLDKLMRQPDEVGGVETQSCYIVVDDADAHYVQAQEAGADVVLEIKSDGLGRRGYSCRDPEGHIWNFGTYNPGKSLTTALVAAAPAGKDAPASLRPRVLMGLAGLLAALGMAGWLLAGGGAGLAQRLTEATGQKYAAEAERAYAELVNVRAEKRKADEAAAALAKDLEAERTRRLALEVGAGTATEELAKLRSEKQAADEAAAALNKDLEAERAQRLAIETGVGTAARELAEAKSARRAAEAATAAIGEELRRVREALDAAVEAKRISEEKLAVLSAAQAAAPAAKSEPAAQGRSSAAEPPGAQEIETAATGPAPAREDDADRARSGVSAERTRGPRSGRVYKRRQRAVMARPMRFPPTYLVDLVEVPWPYSTWYK